LRFKTPVLDEVSSFASMTEAGVLLEEGPTPISALEINLEDI
jgi:hypothetical protein